MDTEQAIRKLQFLVADVPESNVFFGTNKKELWKTALSALYVQKERENPNWKSIDGWDKKYEVSQFGDVRITETKRVLGKQLNKYGYYCVSLIKNKKYKTVTIHRLVAEAFIPNPNNLPEVNHMDENKTNNSARNLEWCTGIYNLTYGTAIARRARTQSKRIIMTDGADLKMEFPSLRIASQMTGISERNISMVCHEKRKHAGGYMWYYDYEPKEAR